MKKTILFIDDRKYYQKVYGKLLETEYELTYCDNGGETLKVLNTKTFDLHIVDLVMPIMSGKRLLQQICQNLKSKLIVLTTLEGDTVKEDALDNEANEFLVKNDTTPKKLLEYIRKNN